MPRPTGSRTPQAEAAERGTAAAQRAEQARCKVCGQVMTAPMPAGLEEGVGKAVVYHSSACAMLMVLHYTGGMPFKRVELLHESWGIPLADANQWAVVDESVGLFAGMRQRSPCRFPTSRFGG